jgi:hypothetical protein
MPKSSHGEASEVYEVADRLVDGPLREGTSLFSPNEELWRGAPVDELHEAIVEGEREDEEAFETFLERRLADRSDEVLQLAAEVLYLHFLAPRAETIDGETRREHLDRVLGGMEQPVDIPDDFDGVLDAGVMAADLEFVTRRDSMVRYLVDFVWAWADESDGERETLLDDPWAFREFAVAADTEEAQAQRNALLHLVFPETFEPLGAQGVKETVAETFDVEVADSEMPLDRKLAEIRESLAEQVDGDLGSLYDDRVRWRWESDAWEEFLEFTGRLYRWDGFEANIRDYRLEIAENLSETREAFLEGDDEWKRLLEEAFGPPNNLASWRLKDALLTWVDEDPEQARVGLRILWAEDGTAAERIGGFLDVAPDELAGAPEKRLELASFLMMGVDAATYPFYDHEPFRDAYRLVDLPKPDATRPVEAYRRALNFLDALIEDSATRDIEIRDRQDAESLVWMVTGKDPTSLHFLDDELRERLSDFLDEQLPDEEGDGEDAEPGPEEASAEPVDIEGLADQLFLPTSGFRRLVDLVGRRKNVVLEGPSGVGKTHLAERLAYAVLGERADKRIETVQFHPSYGYEQFVQGYRPVADGGTERRNGVFFEFCRRAQTDQAHPYVFVIDAIERGDLSEIFGEVTLLLEPDRRGPDHAVPLQYAESDGETFCVPENVHVVATMDAAARSQAGAGDGVLRRRFAFFDLEPAFGRESFRAYLGDCEVPDDLVERIDERMQALNETIAREVGREYRIGHGYFCPRPTATGPRDEDWYREVVECDIRPLLRDYWFDAPERVDEEIARLLEGLEAAN